MIFSASTPLRIACQVYNDSSKSSEVELRGSLLGDPVAVLRRPPRGDHAGAVPAAGAVREAREQHARGAAGGAEEPVVQRANL